MKMWRNILLVLSTLTLTIGVVVASTGGFEGRNGMICVFGCSLGVSLVGTLVLSLLILVRTRFSVTWFCWKGFLFLGLMFLAGIGLIAEAHTRYVCQKENHGMPVGYDVVLLLDLAGGVLICLVIALFVVLIVLKLRDKTGECKSFLS